MNQPNRSQLSKPSHAALSFGDLRGVFLPLPTPFTSAGEVDLPSLRANIARWNSTRISGYVMLGSTGERVNLDEGEYLQVIEAARETVADGPDGLKFLVGVGQQSTLGTIKEIKRVCAAARIDAVLVLTPHFYRPSITQSALVDHYRAVASESAVPVILYSMPALTGITIDPETLGILSEHENIIGIKDSSADVDGLGKTVKLVQKDFAVLTGNGTVFEPALRAGAGGGILAVGCVATALCLEIFRALKCGENDRATMLQAKLTPLAAAVTTRFGIGGLKAALEFRGFVGGAVRAPLRAPDKEACEEIRTLLEAAERALNESSVQETGASDVRSQRSEVRGQT